MRQQNTAWLGEFGDAHCVLQFQVRRDWFILIERTFENQEISVARELRKLFRKTSVGSINKACAALVRQLDGQTLWPMRSLQKSCYKIRQNLDFFICFVAGYFFEFQRKLQLEELVVVRLIDCVQQLLAACTQKDLERLRPRLRLRRMLDAKQKGREPAAMIQVQVANPDCL